MKAEFSQANSNKPCFYKGEPHCDAFLLCILFDKNTAKYIDLLPFQYEKIPFSNLSHFIWWLMKNKLVKLSPVME